MKVVIKEGYENNQKFLKYKEIIENIDDDNYDCMLWIIDGNILCAWFSFTDPDKGDCYDDEDLDYLFNLLKDKIELSGGCETGDDLCIIDLDVLDSDEIIEED